MKDATKVVGNLPANCLAGINAATGLLIILIELLLPSSRTFAQDPANTSDKPNIVFIMVDDLGKEWVGCYGADNIETPHIDCLAAGGMKFSNVYCMPQCTPTRLTLLTGQYPFRHGWVNHWDVPRWGGGCSFDPQRNPSLGLLMKEAGYSTACAGKWQIDDFRQEPDAMQAAGFDDWCMWTGYESQNPPSGKRYYDPYLFTRHGSKTWTGEFGPDVFTEFVLNYISENRDSPFFIYYPMTLTHGPLVATPDHPTAEGTMQKHRAMVASTDRILGQIVKRLDDEGIRDNTIIVWTTDNGTSRGITGSINGHSVKGGKGLTSENGICVPFIVNSPGTVPCGETVEALVDFTDLLPTFVDMAGGTLPDQWEFDGHSFKPLIYGQIGTSARKWIMAMGGQNRAKLTDQGVENEFWFRDRVLRDEQFKLYIGVDRLPTKLFDLQIDPFEKSNLVASQDAKHRDAVQRLSLPVKQMPRRDNDPVYAPLPHQPWYRTPNAKSLEWKTGYPGK